MVFIQYTIAPGDNIWLTIEDKNHPYNCFKILNPRLNISSIISRNNKEMQNIPQVILNATLNDTDI